MENHTRNVIMSQETGEVFEEYSSMNRSKKSFFQGPKRYSRIMQPYDEAQLLLGSKVGIHLMIYLKGNVSPVNYRIHLNNTWLAKDLGVSRDAIIKNIKKLIEADYLIKEDRGQYFINPDMFWVENMSDEHWQQLKKDYQFKLTS